jgi:hypothetical protein
MFVELSKHINLDDEKHAPPPRCANDTYAEEKALVADVDGEI